jgi:hypothetical protein
MMLAEQWRCNSTEAIERLIRERITAGDLPDSTPGLEVAAFGNLVAFKIDFDRTPPMSWEQALKISQALDRLASGAMNGFKCAYSEDTSIVFTRRGDGFSVSFSSPGDEKTKDVTATIVEDLARQFRAAALAAKANKSDKESGFSYRKSERAAALLA